jgi:hypothetical protein
MLSSCCSLWPYTKSHIPYTVTLTHFEYSSSHSDILLDSFSQEEWILGRDYVVSVCLGQAGCRAHHCWWLRTNHSRNYHQQGRVDEQCSVSIGLEVLLRSSSALKTPRKQERVSDQRGACPHLYPASTLPST